MVRLGQRYSKVTSLNPLKIQFTIDQGGNATKTTEPCLWRVLIACMVCKPTWNEEEKEQNETRQRNASGRMNGGP